MWVRYPQRDQDDSGAVDMVENDISYEEWRDSLMKQMDRNRNWSRIGLWGYHLKVKDEGLHFPNGIIHICDKTRGFARSGHGWGGKHDMIETKWSSCKTCGETIPDGMKMALILMGSNI